MLGRMRYLCGERAPVCVARGMGVLLNASKTPKTSPLITPTEAYGFKDAYGFKNAYGLSYPVFVS